MRIIFLSLAAIGAVATGGAALAQTTSMTTGHRPGMHAPGAGGTGDFFRSHRGFGRDRHRGPRRRHGRSGRGTAPPLYFGVGGYGEPAASGGDGFFAGGGEVRMEGRRPVYDYDRSYPYEWPSAAASDGASAGDRPYGREAMHCTLELSVRVCRGAR